MGSGGGTTGGLSAGGVATGGLSAGGGTTGGLGSGGAATGGLGASGQPAGGVATGGLTTGGLPIGGAATGGQTTGGQATGGIIPTGGINGATAGMNPGGGGNTGGLGAGGEPETGGVATGGTSNDTAADYYVAVDGDDSNPGTVDQPFATLQKAHAVVAPGQKVLIRGGTYMVDGDGSMSGISISKSGTSEEMRIKFWAYPGERPIFDFSNVSLAANQTAAGIYVTGSWLHFKGLEICNVPMPGFGANNGIWAVRTSHNIYELMVFHHNSGPGLSIAYGNGGNLILNCDSYENFDEKNGGEDADGFGIHYQETGTPTIIRGCRAWWNADDGYDLFKQEYSVIIEDSWAIGNGYINGGTTWGPGNGSGFKMGNTMTGVRHTIRNSVAWGNKVGFYANHSHGGSDWFNNTSYDNGTNFNMLSDVVLSGDLVHYMRNNVSFPRSTSNMETVDTEFNTWDLGIAVAAEDFVSVVDDGWSGPRGVDGSLPDIDFLRPEEGSQLIDQGTDVGLPFEGDAPDLGAYEI